MEIAQLSCGDVFIQDAVYSLLVRKGKGGKQRLVRFNGSLNKHYKKYIFWKQTIGEPTGPVDPLMLSSNTGSYMSTRAIEKAFKRIAARAGLSSHYSIHCLRHTYACQLYKASGYNLRLVQKQLGHSSIRTTEVHEQEFLILGQRISRKIPSVRCNITRKGRWKRPDFAQILKSTNYCILEQTCQIKKQIRQWYQDIQPIFSRSHLNRGQLLYDQKFFQHFCGYKPPRESSLKILLYIYPSSSGVFCGFLGNKRGMKKIFKEFHFFVDILYKCTIC
ncbi:MAG: tyrosine-type recombinase/integrase [Planctomycetota bacterium]|jgi:integrase/recombinase XerC